MTVHLSDWAQQPDIHIACGGWTTPKWGSLKYQGGDRPEQEGVYYGEPREGRLEDGERILYTFEEGKVTCEACLRREGAAEIS